jgi:hypothetical protein
MRGLVVVGARDPRAQMDRYGRKVVNPGWQV